MKNALQETQTNAASTSVWQQVQRLGLAAAIAAFSYQPAMQASSLSITAPSPTAPMIDTLVAAVPNSEIATAKNTTQPQQIAQVLSSSSFVGSGNKNVAGQAQIVEDNGQHYLEFDQAFLSDNGPDLFVLLHREDVPSSYSAENYVNLGRLQSINGTQRYTIPDNVSLSDFRSAVIWCQQFDVTFGYATL
ncbi:MAG: DM13 domain-containing protein [Cyanobacteria bacterium J06649_4]